MSMTRLGMFRLSFAMSHRFHLVRFIHSDNELIFFPCEFFRKWTKNKKNNTNDLSLKKSLECQRAHTHTHIACGSVHRVIVKWNEMALTFQFTTLTSAGSFIQQALDVVA